MCYFKWVISLKFFSLSIHFFAQFLIPFKKTVRRKKTLELSCTESLNSHSIGFMLAYLLLSSFFFHSSVAFVALAVAIVIIIISIQLSPSLLFIYFEWHKETHLQLSLSYVFLLLFVLLYMWWLLLFKSN